MTLWSDIAEWRGPVLHHNGTIAQHLYVVIHIADGSYEGTIAWQKNPKSGNSSHFVVRKDGHIAQVNDTANRSGAQVNGNPNSIAIENEGFTGTPLTDAQLRANAAILRKAHESHGIPLQLTGKVGTPGLGHHSMGYESGVDWGHQFCPGEIIKGQKAQILAYALGQPTGGTTTMTMPGAYDDYLPDTAMAILTGETPRFGYPAATGPAWDNDALANHNLKAVEGRLSAKIDAIQVTLTDAQFAALLAKVDAAAEAAAERAVRKVLGGLDGATPAGG